MLLKIHELTRPSLTGDLAQLALWAILEPDVGMICGSIPALRYLFARSDRTDRHPRDPRHRKSFSSRIKEFRRKQTLNRSAIDGIARDPGFTTSSEEIVPADHPQGQIRATTQVRVVSTLPESNGSQRREEWERV